MVRQETMSIRAIAAMTSFVFSVLAARAAVDPVSPYMPFAFVENRGQASPLVRYIGTGHEFKAWFEDRGIVLRHAQAIVKIEFEGDPESAGVTRHIEISADNSIGARANYLYGRDPSRWQTDLPLFGSIHYAGIWPGVELTYKVEHGNLKAEYLVAPGAKVEPILLRF